MRSKKAVYNIIANFILQLITIVYGLIVPKIIITKYGSEVNGLVTSITQFLGYIALLESGFGPVVKSLLYKPIAKKDKKEIANILKASEKFFKKITKIFLVYILILSVFYPILANNNFSFIYTISLIVIISMSTFAQYYFGMTYQLYLQAEQKTYVRSVIQIITYVSSVIIIVLLSFTNCSIHLIKLLSGLVFVLRPILQNLYVKKKYNIKFDNVDTNYKIKNKWDGLAQHVAAVVHGNTDITILTFFRNLSEVSVYSVYSLIVTGIKQFIQIFSTGIDSTFGDMLARKEQDNLNKKFNMYEILYMSITTIIFTCSMILIVPFVKIYTNGITDANYVSNSLGYLIVISEYIWAIRLPYSSLALAAGHFKETKKGAWIECLVNTIISLVLVFKFGVVGVVIGTIVAMLIRTIEFVYHTNKYILKRNVSICLKKIILVVIETIIILMISHYIPYFDTTSYYNWILNAIITVLFSCLVVLLFDYLFYKNELKSLLSIIKNVFCGKNRKSTE